MHLLLTDRLTCSRCGPEFGLILLAERMEERRVLEGVLGCPNCRDAFPVRDGFGDLRAPPRGALPVGRAGLPQAEDSDGDREGAGRLAALLGVVEGPGTLLLLGRPVRLAGLVADAVPGVEVAALDADLNGWPEHPRVSRFVSRPGIPFFSRCLRGVVVDGELGEAWLDEAARVVAPLSRVVVTHASESAADRLVGLGLEILASETGTVVAARG